jgi:CheY-like chemotaxis protein
VLVIDDEPGILRSLDRLIGREHDLETLEDAREALARVRAGQTWDLIFCDVMMPNLSGLELWEALQADFPALASRVVFLTGGAFSTAAAERLQTLPNLVLRKPFSAAALHAAIDQVTGGAKA